MSERLHDYLKRLPPECYCGRAFVHWTLTIEDRKTGWLIPIFYYKYREILTHTAFRFGLCCLVPGYPELKPFEQEYWDRFWRIYSHLLKNGLHVRTIDEAKGDDD